MGQCILRMEAGKVSQGEHSEDSHQPYWYTRELEQFCLEEQERIAEVEQARRQLLFHTHDLSRILRREKRRTSELRTLTKAVEARFAELSARDRVWSLIASGRDLEETLGVLLDTLHDTLGWRRVLLHRVDWNTHSLVPEAGIDADGQRISQETLLDSPRFRLDDSLSQFSAVARSGQLSLVTDEFPLGNRFHLDSRSRPTPGTEPDRATDSQGDGPQSAGYSGRVKSVFAVAPIVVRGECVGMLVADKDEPIDHDSLSRLGVAANQAALAIDSARSVRSLEDKRAQRTMEWEVASAEIQKLHRLKDDFLSLVSHELRTPLASMSVLVDNLLDYPGEETAVHREFLFIVQQELLRLSRIIESMLDMSSIQAGKMAYNFEAGKLGAIVERVANIFQVQADSKRISIVVDVSDDLPEVFFDRDKIVQVLASLIANALKFTPEHGTVSIAASQLNVGPGFPARESGPCVLVSVKDTGVGICHGDQARIFKPFVQLGSLTTGKPSGVGLGLAICRGIVEQHGGIIWVESEPEKGSTFCFTLPLDGAPDRRKGKK